MSTSRLSARIRIFIFAIALTSASCDRQRKYSAEIRSELDLQRSALEAERAEEEIARGRRLASADGARKFSPSAASREIVYVVQVGSFKIEANADKLEQQLKGKGLPAMKKKVDRAGGSLYMVRLEPTPNRAEAERFLISLKEVGQSGVILTFSN